MKSRLSVKVVLVLFITSLLLLSVTTSTNALAATLSPGCTAMNGYSVQLGVGITAIGVLDDTFNAGEVVTVTSSGTSNNWGFLLGEFFPTGVAGNSFTITIPSTASRLVNVVNYDMTSGNFIRINVTCRVGGSSAFAPIFTDGRINRYDAQQTAAIYCTAGGVTVYTVRNSVGHFAFHATKADIQAIPAKPKVNTLIKKGNGSALYRLTSGELEVVGPLLPDAKSYIYIWTSC